MPTKRHFSFSLMLTVLLGSLIALMIGLGLWQLDRAAFKRALFDDFSRSQETSEWTDFQKMPERFTPVSLRGRYLSKYQIIADGITMKQRPGYYVLTAFAPDNSGQLLMVNRGWRPWAASGRQVPMEEIKVHNRPVYLSGRAQRFPQPGMVLGSGNQQERASWPRLAIYPQAQEIAQWTGEPVLPWLLLMDADKDDGFVRDWKPVTMNPQKHTGYALQWFAMAIAVFVFYLIFSFPQQEVDGEIDE